MKRSDIQQLKKLQGADFTETDRRSAGQDNLHRLLHPKVHYRHQTNMPLISIASRPNTIHCFIYYIFLIHFNAIPHLRLVSLPAF
jgi:hypothetical protein